MKSLALIPLLLLAPATAAAQEGAIDLGLAGGVFMPDDLEVLGTAPTFSPRIGYWPAETMLIEADLGFSTGNTSIGTPEPFNFLSLTPRLNMVGRVWPDKPINVLFVAGVGAWYKKVSDEGELALPQGDGADLDFLGNAGPGLMVPLGDVLALRTDLRWMLSLGGENWQNRGDAFMSWEWTAGLSLILGGTKDTDKDGIADDIDKCIDDAEDMDGFSDEDGCPDLDNDGDGIADVDDTECPNDAEDMDQFEDEDGCPELDNDGDGINDVDEDPDCINLTGVESAQGCPDADGDGLRDRMDECKDTAADENDVANAFGCPDGDDDRVPDYRDECPEEAAQEDINPMRSNGCPGRVYYAADRLVITEKINFASGRATIQRSSTRLLQLIAETLKLVPDVKKVEVGGHTDASGDDDKNMKLSEDRAAAVVARLVELGVEEERLTAKGYGETKPVGDNETDEGKAANRRVEFIILEQAENVRRVRNKKAEEGEGEDEGADDGKKTAPREAPAKEEAKEVEKKTAPREAPAKEEAKAEEGEKKTATREAPAKEEGEAKAEEGEKKTAPREAPAKEEGEKAE